MRRNYDKHARNNGDMERYDRVYVEWPHLWEVRQVVARPMKTIYINRCANAWAQDKIFTGVTALENFCDRWGLELP